MLLVDIYQPNTDLDALNDSPEWGPVTGGKWEVQHLNHGDYAMSFYNRREKAWKIKEVWESKTWSDLLSSFASKRLLQQLLKMKAAYPNGSGLLISDEPLETWSNEESYLNQKIRTRASTGSWRDSLYSVSSIRGLLLTIQSRGIRVIETNQHGGLSSTLAFLHRHAQAHRDDVDHFYRGDAAVPIAMLDVIPRITPETAERIYNGAAFIGESAGSLAAVIELTLDELEQLIGPLAAKEVYKRLH